MSGDVPLSHMPLDTKWKKSHPTTIYDKNYSYGINYYQPMIDYIDKKSQNVTKNPEYPEMPWSDERLLWERKRVLPYTAEELIQHAMEAEDQAKDHLSHFKIAKRSDFSLRKAVEATHVSKDLLPSNIDETTKSLRNERPIPLDVTMADLMVQTVRNNEKMRHVKQALDHSVRLRGKSARAIEFELRAETAKNLSGTTELADIRKYQREAMQAMWDERDHVRMMEDRAKLLKDEEMRLTQPLDELTNELKELDIRSSNYYMDKSKQTSIEIEQLNARVVEAETKLKTEVTRIKKKLQIQITELELSLDVANKNNIDLQKTIKKQSLTLTELQSHYDEVQRQLSVTLDQLGISQRRLQSLTAEIEEIRGNYESALRAKRNVEQQYEESVSRINELTTINVNITSSKSKLEQELTALAGDYEEVTKELRVSDERYQRVQTELKHTVEILHEEQERIVKIESIKKSLEIEVKNLSVRLEEVEANAIVGGKRIISKLESRIRDLELELDEEKRRHAETVKILRKKERNIKEVMIQVEEDAKNIALLQESLDKSQQKVSIYKRQLQEQEGMSQQSFTRVRRFQRELEAAEDRADTAESNLTLIRAKHRSFVTTSTVPGSQVYLVQESRQELN
ncbi:hypothetical protein KQX54_005496 [Cotesia glomerata]|uniref:Paramyosin n=1 Tax=Cotesia glomerata TaxID=32391 RepID=A0AAV7I181_COTGL|nr:hypothetical protein KQX54_005496 [Cotesia glomerata]